jgi:cell division protein FtsQ
MTLLKKIGYILGITVLTAALGAYFYFAATLVRARGESARCQNVIITVKDSVRNPLTGAGEVAVYLDREHISLPGKNFDEIDFTRLEKQLGSFASVKKCNAVRTIDGTLRLDLLQHKPIFRMDTPKGSFFVSNQQYLFPMVNPYRMPVLTVTGDIPFRYPANYRGYIAPSDDWMLELNSLNNYIGEHPFWNRQVKRVFVNRSDDIHIVPLEEDLCLMIGSLENHAYKMHKLYEFYRVLVPLNAKVMYDTIDARFGDQIVCTFRKTEPSKKP